MAARTPTGEGRWEKVMNYKAHMNDHGESDRSILPLCGSTSEGPEQRRETAGGRVGGKGTDQGEHRRVELVPDTESGKRVQPAGRCAASRTAG